MSPGEKARLLQQLAKETSETSEPLPEKGLLALPFMRRAIEKKRERNREEIAKLQRLSNNEGGEDSEDDDSEEDEGTSAGRKRRRKKVAEDSDLESQPDEMDDERLLATDAETRDGGGAEEEKKRDRLKSLQKREAMDRKNIKNNLDPDAVKKAENELGGLWNHFELKGGEDEDEEKERKELDVIGREDDDMEKQMKLKKEKGEGEREGRKGFFESAASAKSFFKEALKVEEQAREEREKKRRREKIEEEVKREQERRLREARTKKNSQHMKDDTTRAVESENPWLVASSGKNKKRRKTRTGEKEGEEEPLGDANQNSSGHLAFSSNPSSLLTPEEQLEEYVSRRDVFPRKTLLSLSFFFFFAASGEEETL